MKNLKSKSAFLYPIILSLLLSSPTLAQCPPPTTTPDFEPFELMNMETAPFSVPQVSNVNNTGSPLQLFNVGQSASTPCTITGQWTPNSTASSSTQGLLEFRANVYAAGFLNTNPPPPVSNNYYLLTISSAGVAISVVTGSGQTVLGSTSQTFTGSNQFQLSWTNAQGANPYTFSVVDVSSGVTILTATDPNNTIAQGAAIYAGSNGMNAGTWSLSVSQPGLKTPLPPIGNAGIVVPSFAQVNTGSSTQSMAQHFGFSNKNYYMDLCATPMVQLSSFGDNQELGRVTCHRWNGQGGTSNDYAVYFCKGQLEIGKTVAGTEYVMASHALPTKLQQGHPLALHITAADNSDGSVTINVYATELSQGPPYIPPVPSSPLVWWTDNGTSGTAANGTTLPAIAPYTQGYQFGLYTQPLCGTCWDIISLTPVAPF